MAQPVVGILDCGCGNLRSVSKAVNRVGGAAEISKKVNPDWAGLILPGVGAFGHAMRSIEDSVPDLLSYLDDGRPFLGICLGLQVLFESSQESGGIKGLGLVKGNVVRIGGRKVPHMGWNSLDIRSTSRILEGISQGDYFYFVHSFAAEPEENVLVASCRYEGQDLTAVVEAGNLRACQFHPEKSGVLGLRILRNFINLSRSG